jgi:hypothetical protein
MAQTGDPGTIGWRKSTRCESHQCVEIALGEGEAGIRNSASPEHHLTFAAPTWRNFIAGVQAGEFAAR